MKSCVCVGILFVLGILTTASAQVFYVSAPNSLRLDSDETIGIAVEAPNTVLVHVFIQDHPGRIRNLTETILEVKPSQPEVFKVRLNSADFPPSFLTSPGSPKRVILNVRGPNFQKDVVIPIIHQSGYVFIQTDKPIYTPRQRVNIRIIPLDEDQLPSDNPFRLQIKNPRDIIVEETLFNRRTTEQRKSIVSHNYKFPTYPVLGQWSATVLYGYEFQQNATVHFELKEYVLPTFTVELKAQEIILPTDEFINAVVTARYVYGKKVRGMVTFRLGVKGLVSEAVYFAVIGPNNMNDGSYTLRIKADEISRHEAIGWFPEIEGSHLIVEATVVDDASGNKETATDAKGVFSNSPFRISFKRCLQDFKPGLVSVFEADITFASGKPASGIETQIKAKADNTMLDLKQNSAISDKEGKVSFEIHPETSHQTLTITIETVDPRYARNQASGTFIQRKFESKSKAFIALERSSGQKLKPGDHFVKVVYLEPAEIKDIYYMVVSKGKILLLNKMAHGQFKVQRLEFKVTHDMVPSFRIVVFAHYKNELIGDSLKIDVEHKCNSNAEVTIQPDFNVKEPGHNGKIIISGPKSTLVGLLGVDEAVYALSKKDLLTKSKVFSKFEKHDLGCGPGGGLTIDNVLGNAGIALATNIYNPPLDSSSSCTEIKRRKREIANEILSNYNGLDKECCGLGMSHDIHNRNCEDRANILVTYLKGEHRNCSTAFLECCLYAKERGFTDMKIRRTGVPLGRRGGEDIDEVHFISTEDEAEFERDITVRSDFRETWLFEDIFIGPDAREEFPVSLPHSITTWVIQAVSVSKTFGICIAEPQKLVSFKKVFLQLNLPYSVVRNEQVEIQATVFNYGWKRLNAIVYMYGVKDLCTGTQEGEKSERKKLVVEGQSAATVTFPVIPLKDGNFDIKVVALSPEGSDVIVRKLNVVPEGNTEEINIAIKLDPSNIQRRSKRHITTDVFSDSIDPSQNLQVTAIKLSAPQGFVPGTESCSITALGDQLGPTVQTAINNPDALLQKPHGCGEQNMMFLAPTLYTMRYLKATGRITPESEEKGFAFIRHGYGNQLSFRKEDGSYAAYQNKPTSTWLTAFVMKVFCQANELVYIDENVLCSGIKWLLKNQQPDGSYVETHPMYHVDMMGGVQGKTPMTAFALIALEECKCDAENLHLAKKRAVAFLEQTLGDANKPLPVAIVAYALSLGDSNLKQAANDKLLSLAERDEDRNMMYWNTENSAQDIETGGYALLNQLLFNDMPKASSIVNWLNAQQLQSGSFKSTQDTVVALQALSEYAIRAQMPSINLVANISSSNDRNFHKVLSFREDNALVLQDIKVDRIGGTLFINTAGHGVGSLAVKLRYNVLYPPERTCKFELSVNVTESKNEVPVVDNQHEANGGNDMFNLLQDDLIRGAHEVLEAEPDVPNLDVDPRNRGQRASLVADIGPLNSRFSENTRNKRQAGVENSKVTLKISICARYLGKNNPGMSIADVGIFSGFVPQEKDLIRLQDDPTHLIQRYEKSSRGVVFYLQTVPTNEKYCFDFRVIREYIVGNIQTSVVKVYDYYSPDDTCTEFYSPGSNSPMLHTICEGGICQCAEGGCPPKTPFPEVSNLEYGAKREKLKEIACDKYDYVWKGKLDGSIKKDGGFYNISFLIEEVIKEGIEKSSLLEGETRTLLARDNCESAWLNPNAEYLILGKDGQKYQNKNGEIWHRYLLDKTSTIYMWANNPKHAKDQALQRALKSITRKLKKEGCDQ